MRPLPLLLTALLVLGSAKAIEWPQFHADSLHTGTVPSDFAPPRERWWSQSTGGPIDGSPVVSDGRVFVGSTDGRLYAFDAISGSPLWVFDAGSPISGTPALSGGILYVVTNSGSLFALDAVSGKKRLVAGEANPQPGATRASPSVHEGRLYIATEEGAVVAYSLQTLTQDWAHRPSEERFVVQKQAATNTTPAVYGCETRGFPARPIRSSPAVYANKVFFGSDMHFFFAVEEFGLGGADAGKTRGAWALNSTLKAECFESLTPQVGDVIRASPAIDAKNNLVIVAAYDNIVRALDVRTGRLAWSFDVTDNATGRDSRVISTPAVDNGRVYFGSFNGNFYALESTGPAGASTGVRLLWQFVTPTRDAVWSSPAVSNGLVVFGADDETVYVLDANTGQERWKYRTGGDVRSSPAIWTGGVVGAPIQGGVLYVGSSDGILYAFGGQKPALADLLIANLTYPKDPLPIDSDVDLNVTVRNGGDSAAPVTELKIYIDGALASTQPVVALAKGESASLTYVWHVPNEAVNHTLRVVVDAAGAVREFDRGNNEVKVDTPVAKAPPPPPEPPAPTNTTQETQPPPKKKSPGPELLVVAGVAALLALATRRRGR